MTRRRLDREVLTAALRRRINPPRPGEDPLASGAYILLAPADDGSIVTGGHRVIGSEHVDTGTKVFECANCRVPLGNTLTATYDDLLTAVVVHVHGDTPVVRAGADATNMLVALDEQTHNLWSAYRLFCRQLGI